MFCTFEDVLHMLQLCLPRISEIAVNLKQTHEFLLIKNNWQTVCAANVTPPGTVSDPSMCGRVGLSRRRFGIGTRLHTNCHTICNTIKSETTKPNGFTNMRDISKHRVTFTSDMVRHDVESITLHVNNCYITLNIQIFLYIPLHSLIRYVFIL